MELKEFQELVLKQFDNISEQFKKVADRLDSLEKGQDGLRKRQDELTVRVEVLAREQAQFKAEALARFDNLQKQTDLIAGHVLNIRDKVDEIAAHQESMYEIIGRHEVHIQTLRKRPI
ncbi:MAG: hypothetical protein HPY90_13865 [Syntrophothermus sp.]|uniref:hypothetical protein n=1 Tax=Syntrophothermus sp. TaxID=2736299 RepID=UPI00257C8E10|nr:hypothetical protein [Syntrophothermus sp.]NSW84326.1 hypothetical protein [Syntrophothermus sp.]